MPNSALSTDGYDSELDWESTTPAAPSSKARPVFTEGDDTTDEDSDVEPIEEGREIADDDSDTGDDADQAETEAEDAPELQPEPAPAPAPEPPAPALALPPMTRTYNGAPATTWAFGDDAPAPAPEPAPEPAPAPAPEPAAPAPRGPAQVSALERFQNLQGFKRKASPALRKRLPNHDVLLKAHRGLFPEERIANLVLEHATCGPRDAAGLRDEQVEEIVCLLVQALTTNRPEWHDLRSFFEFVKTEEDYNVQGVLCEHILQWDVKVDEPARLIQAVVAFYKTLQALATSVLHA